jgi:hypothetical protein
LPFWAPLELHCPLGEVDTTDGYTPSFATLLSMCLGDRRTLPTIPRQVASTLVVPLHGDAGRCGG